MSSKQLTETEILKQSGTVYLKSIPSALPAGVLLVHNHIKPQAELGLNGFRAWLATSAKRLEMCPCNWAPHLGTHYRVKEEQ